VVDWGRHLLSGRKLVHKRPDIEAKYRIKRAVRELPADFPIRLGEERIHLQDDKPITSLHEHGCLEIGYWIDGSGVFVVEDKVMPYRAGDVAVTPAGEVHFGRSSRGTVSRSTWVFLDPEKLLLPAWPRSEYLDARALSGSGFRNIVSGDEHPEVRDLVLALIDELDAKATGYRACVRGLVMSLLVRLHRLAGDGSQRDGASPEDRRRRAALERVTPALALMAADYSRSIYVEELATACHSSVTNFRRIFRRAVSRRPMEYLAQLRVQMAVGLLESTTRRVREIGAEVGFETASSFNRQFRRVTGSSPKAWRLARAAQRPGMANG
jgi:AraC-like DNA-binding protein/mannose-6-phosphate isomerase-like protein (cupin superfamily)